jgi:hypothetical protein
MRRIIHNLKQRPEHHRRLVAFGISTLLVSIMFVVWISTLSIRYDKVTARGTPNTAAALEAITPPHKQPQYAPAQNDSDLIISDPIEYQ